MPGGGRRVRDLGRRIGQLEQAARGGLVGVLERERLRTAAG